MRQHGGVRRDGLAAHLVLVARHEAAADRVVDAAGELAAVGVEGGEAHAVGVEGQRLAAVQDEVALSSKAISCAAAEAQRLLGAHGVSSAARARGRPCRLVARQAQSTALSVPWPLPVSAQRAVELGRTRARALQQAPLERRATNGAPPHRARRCGSWTARCRS